jgi:NAD-dependent deacetylase
MKLFVLTGAGVSAESGLGTFRDKGGLWEEFDPMTLATPEAFARDPELVHAFYTLRRRRPLRRDRNLGRRLPGRRLRRRGPCPGHPDSGAQPRAV